MGAPLTPSRSVVPESSIEDEREYVRYTLPNGMEILLVHDPNMGVDDNALSEAEQRAERAAKEDDDEDQQDGGDEGEDMMDGDEDEEFDEEFDEDGEGDEEEDDEEMMAQQSAHAAAGAAAPKKRAAAALCVSAGSFADPLKAQGISHFLEHMVFMGSTEFPCESEYDAYLSRHGGASNAWTDMEQTTFHFDVDPNSLYGGLCRFAGFFTGPLCKADSVSREVNAVHSEFQQTLQSDYSRVEQMQCYTCKPGHPFTKFSWGNKASLLGKYAPSDVSPSEWDSHPPTLAQLRGELMAHHNRHYFAKNMSLVVVGGQPIDTLSRWVNELFSSVPADATEAAIATGPTLSPLPPPLDGANPPPYTSFSPFEGGILTYTKGVKQRHELSITWALPPGLKTMYRFKVEDYLSHMLGHEGAGSLLQYLKMQGLASDLSAGVGLGGLERNNDCLLCTVSIGLTDAGFRARAREEKSADGTAAFIGLGLAAAEAVHAYMRMLRDRHAAEGFLSYAYDELHRQHRASFLYADEEPSDEYAARLASTLRLYAPNDALVGDNVLLAAVDENGSSSSQGSASATKEEVAQLHEAARALLAYMTPENARYDVVSAEVNVPRSSKDLSGNSASACLPEATDASLQVEPHFDTPFIKARIADDLLASWASVAVPDKLHPPAPNPFVPADFELLCDSPEAGDEIISTLESCGAPQLVAEVRSFYKPSADSGARHARKLGMKVRDTLTRVAPVVVMDEPGVRAWHKPDRNCHRSPRARIYVHIHMPALAESADTSAHTTLFIRTLFDAASELTYVAETAGIYTDFIADGPRVEVKFEGFSDKLAEYVGRFMACLAFFDPAADGGGMAKVERTADSLPSLTAEMGDAGSSTRRFERVRENVLKDLRSANIKPSRHVSYLRLLTLKSGARPLEARIAAMERASASDVAATWRAARAQCHVDVLVIGNADSERAANIARDARSSIDAAAASEAASPLAVSARQFSRCACIPAADISTALPGKVLFCMAENPDETNTAVELYVQFGKTVPHTTEGDKLRALAGLLEQVMEEPFYDTLRTKEQLGYTAHASMRNSFGCVGFMFSVVSSRFHAAHVTSRIYKFLESFDIAKQIDDAAFANHKESLISRKREPFANLADEAESLWHGVYDDERDFGARHRTADVVAKLTRDDLVRFYDAHVRPCARRCVFLDSNDGKVAAANGDRRELLVIVSPHQGDASLDAEALRAKMVESCSEGVALTPDHIVSDPYDYGVSLPRW